MCSAGFGIDDGRIEIARLGRFGGSVGGGDGGPRLGNQFGQLIRSHVAALQGGGDAQLQVARRWRRVASRRRSMSSSLPRQLLAHLVLLPFNRSSVRTAKRVPQTH